MLATVTVISTGEELVRGRIADSNAAFLAAQLGAHGFEVLRLVAVGDNPDALRDELLRCLADSRAVLVSGGLGPTADDRTRRAIAEAVGRDLVEDEESRRHVTQRLRRFGVQVSAAQCSQSLFPAGSVIFPNERGTARGFACRLDESWVVAMPGVPDEMRAMFSGSVLPFLLGELAPAGCIRTEVVHLFPVSEAVVDEGLRDVMGADRNPAVGITVNDGVITVSFRARAASEDEAEELVRADVALVEERFGDLVFGRGDVTLAGALSAALERAGRTVAVAESVTGGLVGHMLVDVPGISRFFLADVVAYGNEAKVRQLGVPPEQIERHGAVSSEVAEAMAAGICRVTGAGLGLSTTGIAGPTGGSEQKPVGLVHVGVCLDGRTTACKLLLRGDRRRIKDRAAKHALNLARLALAKGVDSLGKYRTMWTALGSERRPGDGGEIR